MKNPTSTRATEILDIAQTCHQAGDVEKAERLYREVMTLEPASPVAANGLAAILLHRGHSKEAAALYEMALAASPSDIRIQGNLAQALGEMGCVEKSMRLYRAIAKQTASLPTQAASPHKITHDRQQKEFLTKKGLPLSDFSLESGDRVTPSAIADRHDTEQLSAQWDSNKPRHIVVDNVLAPAALRALQNYCLSSTIWRESYSSGYVGAMPEHGLGSPLFAQIIEELRAAFRFAFKDHPLLYYWAFKYDSDKEGTGIHADSAILSANLWITPDSANKNPKSGGLVLWDVGPPADWPFDRYNTKNEEIPAYLRQQKAQATIIPYRCNRMVIFDSLLFHKTDEFDFDDGYENRRVNITLLFGRRG